MRCPWHHACFSLRTGEPLRPPALNPVDCWRVERHGDMVLVREKATPSQSARPPTALPMPKSILILGGGAAGNMAAETLRREGYVGKIVMLSADASIPYDRPNLSKDYLSGDASDDWIPLRSPEFYNEHGIEVHLDASARLRRAVPAFAAPLLAGSRHLCPQHYRRRRSSQPQPQASTSSLFQPTPTPKSIRPSVSQSRVQTSFAV